MKKTEATDSAVISFIGISSGQQKICRSLLDNIDTLVQWVARFFRSVSVVSLNLGTLAGDAGATQRQMSFMLG
jgi:hypothetical protein